LDLKTVLDALKRPFLSAPVNHERTKAMSVIAPEGHSHQLVDLEVLADAPDRKRGVFTVYTAESFNEYFNRHKVTSPENAASLVFADGKLTNPGQAVIGVLNPHALDKPAWHDHRVVLSLRPSREWETWTGANRKSMPQATFAEFIENNSVDIVRPEGAAILEMVTSFQAKRNVDFKQATRLQNGDVQLQYEDTTTATAGAKGNLEVPEKFTILIPIFDGDQPVEIEARFRYRISEGKLFLFFDLLRPENKRDEAFAAIVEEITTGTGAKPLYGVPASEVRRPFKDVATKD